MDAAIVRSLQRAVARHPAVRVAVVYGSRARGEDHAGSDWDIGYLADPELDRLSLRADITSEIGTEDVDVVDLARASGLLAFQAARDGVLVHESPPGAWDDFAIAAALYWYDVEPVVRQAHAELLADLRP